MKSVASNSTPPSSFFDPFSPTKKQKPIATWPVRIQLDGTIDPTPPPVIRDLMKAKKVDNFLYRIKRNGDETSRSKRYCGSSIDGTNRFTGYKSAIKNALKPTKTATKKTQKIVRAILQSPERFSIAVLSSHPGISEAKLREKEEDLILRSQTLDPQFGYNVSLPTHEPLRAKKKAGELPPKVNLLSYFDKVV